MTLTDDMQKCNPKPITIETENRYTLLAQSTRSIHASISVRNDHSRTGTVKLRPQFDECGKLKVAAAITTARDKQPSKLQQTLQTSPI